jgi:hypothetical protein
MDTFIGSRHRRITLGSGDDGNGSEVGVWGGRERWDMGKHKERGILSAYGIRDGKRLTGIVTGIMTIAKWQGGGRTNGIDLNKEGACRIRRCSSCSLVA